MVQVPVEPPVRCHPDRRPELLLIAEAGRRLADSGRARRPEDIRSITAMLDRQQRMAASRARGRPVDPSPES